MDYESFMQATRLSLVTSAIALMVRDRMNEGRGAPTKEDMARYIEEAEGIVELYEEALDGILMQIAIREREEVLAEIRVKLKGEKP